MRFRDNGLSLLGKRLVDDIVLSSYPPRSPPKIRIMRTTFTTMRATEKVLSSLTRRRETLRAQLEEKMTRKMNDDENSRKEENCYYEKEEKEEEEEKEEAEEKKTTKKVLLLMLFEREIEKHSARAKALKETVEEETRRNDAMEKNVREREERARREKRAMEKRATKKKKKFGGVFSSSSVKETEENARRDEDIRELIKIRLKSCEFELRCERSRLFGEVKDVFELESGGERKVRGRNDSISSYGKFLPDVDAFAYSSKQSTQNNNNNNNNNNNKDLDAFIEVLFNSSNKKSDDKIENENEIAATLSMMNRFVTLLGKYSFCPSLHRSTPGVTNATEIWKPLDSTTTSSSRNFERGGKESFDDDDDDYARDEAVKVDEFFRKTFGNEDVVLYGDIASPECEILPLYYARAAPKRSGGVGGEEEEDARAQKKRLLRAVRLLQKSCEIVAAHFAAEVTELVTSDIFDDDAEEDENQYHFTRRLMKELNGNTNNATRGGPFCSLLVAFEALVEIAERKRLQDLYYRSSASSSSSSMSCEELFSSEDDDDDNNKEGFEPVVVISSSLRNIDNTAKSKATMTTKKKNRKSSRKRQLAEKSKSMIKSVWSFVAEPTKKFEKNLKLTRVPENNDDNDEISKVNRPHRNAENEDEDWDVVDVPHTLIRKTPSSNSGDSKTKNIRLPPPPCEEENLNHYVRAMFTDKQ